MVKNSTVRTRIAPSPTGPFHVGTARTALFNWLYTHQNEGKFILRMEDTDKKRSKKKYEDEIKDGLKWLGLNWDEEHKQSSRFDTYRAQAEKLLKEKKAHKDGDAIVLKNPKKPVVFTDIIRGDIKFSATALKEEVIIKSDGSPTYNFAVVVDDEEMKISHIIRGEDHISNTPKQINIQKALGFKTPSYAHIPLILATDKSKLSKRHGAVSINEYKEMGYLADAMVNFMALLGWNPGGEQEIFSRDELVKSFNIKKAQKGGAIFDIEKLRWINQQYIQNMLLPELTKELSKILNQKITPELTKIVQPRIHTLTEAKDDLVWLNRPQYSTEKLNWKNTDKKTTKENLEAVLVVVEKNKDPEKKLMELADKQGRGEVLWPLRVALSGKDKSPSPFELLALVGKKESISRIKTAIKKLGSSTPKF